MQSSFLTAGMLLFCLPQCLAQVAPPGTTSSHKRHLLEATFSPPRDPVPAVTGSPYSADQVIDSERIQDFGAPMGVEGFPVPFSEPDYQVTVAPGYLYPSAYASHVRRSIRIYRDAAGRMRTERSFFSASKAPPGFPVNVQIDDVVTGYRYILDTENRVAHRFVLAVIPGPILPALWRDKDSSTFKSLGTRTIEGVRTEGRKTVHAGRERPRPGGYSTAGPPYGPGVSYVGALQESSEEWYSFDLKATVLMKSAAPNRGDVTIRLKNISRAEPDPSLFQVPPDYRIVEETGSFTIKITWPSR